LIDDADVTVAARGVGGAELMLWSTAKGAWRSLHANDADASDASAELAAALTHDDVDGALFGDGRALHLAVRARASRGGSAAPGQVALDDAELTIRYRLPR
jgi:hypothetical protein